MNTLINTKEGLNESVISISCIWLIESFHCNYLVPVNTGIVRHLFSGRVPQ